MILQSFPLTEQVGQLSKKKRVLCWSIYMYYSSLWPLAISWACPFQSLVHCHVDVQLDPPPPPIIRLTVFYMKVTGVLCQLFYISDRLPPSLSPWSLQIYSKLKQKNLSQRKILPCQNMRLAKTKRWRRTVQNLFTCQDYKYLGNFLN